MLIYSVIVNELSNYSNREAFVSDFALSNIWNDDPELNIPEERIKALGDLYDAANRSIKELAAISGLSQRKLAERFGIPYRTMENWGTEVRECPLYTKLMMHECLGLLDVSCLCRELLIRKNEA